MVDLPDMVRSVMVALVRRQAMTPDVMAAVFGLELAEARELGELLAAKGYVDRGRGKTDSEIVCRARLTHTNGSETHTRLDINRAAQAELVALPKIGPALAQRIIAYREEQGLFERIEDIQKVSGIGEGTFKRIKNLIAVGVGSKEDQESEGT
jgi:comEA protein